MALKRYRKRKYDYYIKVKEMYSWQHITYMQALYCIYSGSLMWYSIGLIRLAQVFCLDSKYIK